MAVCWISNTSTWHQGSSHHSRGWQGINSSTSDGGSPWGYFFGSGRNWSNNFIGMYVRYLCTYIYIYIYIPIYIYYNIHTYIINYIYNCNYIGIGYHRISYIGCLRISQDFPGTPAARVTILHRASCSFTWQGPGGVLGKHGEPIITIWLWLT